MAESGIGFNTSFSDITGAAGDIFGTSQSSGGTSKSSGTSRSSSTEQLELNEAAVTKLIEELLSSSSGLAAIFSGEQSAGIFDSSVANQAAGDLTAKIVGELAKLTSKKTTTTEGEQTSKGSQEQEAGTGGLLDQIGGGAVSSISSGIESIGKSLGF